MPTDTLDDRQQLARLTKGERVAMLTHAGAGGLLTSKPMTVLDHDEQGNFWFYCVAQPHDAVTREAYKCANLAFSDEGRGTYVSVSGRGEVVHDRDRIRALWTAAAKPWFPDGPDTPDLALLKFVPSQAEYWEGPHSGVMRVLAMAASIVAGKPVGLGEHQVLQGVGTTASATTASNDTATPPMR